jgi:peptidoglycan glycosyltransferase
MAFETGPGLYLSGIGQRDVRFTPLQNAMIAATIANGGMRMRPQLIKAQPEPVERAMTERNANTLRDMMVRAEDAAGGSAGPRIASKSATGQIGPAAQSGPDSWYVAFAPADDPKIAIAVLLESKQDAAVIGRAIISQALAAGI